VVDTNGTAIFLPIRSCGVLMLRDEKRLDRQAARDASG
jgi:hypothetical protein